MTLCWCGAVNAAEEPQAPTPVSAYLSRWEVMGKEQDKATYAHTTFNVELLLNCQKPFRFCPIKGMDSTLQMVDAKGGKSGVLNNDMVSFRMVNQGQAVMMSVKSGKWLPTPESAYVDLKGQLGLLISNGNMAETEPVKLDLKEGVSVPVTLKGAGEGDKDVNATLSVKEYVENPQADGRRARSVTLCLTAQAPVAVHNIVFYTLENKLMPYVFSSLTNTPLCLTASMQLPDIPEGAIQVKVTYDQGVKPVKMLIDFRCGWDLPDEPANFGRKEGK